MYFSQLSGPFEIIHRYFAAAVCSCHDISHLQQIHTIHSFRLLFKLSKMNYSQCFFCWILERTLTPLPGLRFHGSPSIFHRWESMRIGFKSILKTFVMDFRDNGFPIDGKSILIDGILANRFSSMSIHGKSILIDGDLWELNPGYPCSLSKTWRLLQNFNGHWVLKKLPVDHLPAHWNYKLWDGVM